MSRPACQSIKAGIIKTLMYTVRLLTILHIIEQSGFAAAVRILAGFARTVPIGKATDNYKRAFKLIYETVRIYKL